MLGHPLRDSLLSDSLLHILLSEQLSVHNPLFLVKNHQSQEKKKKEKNEKKREKKSKSSLWHKHRSAILR